MLDQFLTPVAKLDELCTELIWVDDRVRPDDDRFDLDRAGSQLLKQGAYAGNDHLRATIAVAQPPQHFEALAHRVDGGADAFERQRLPGWEMGHSAGRQELGEVVVQLPSHRPGWAGNHQGPLAGQLGECGDRDRPSHLHNRQSGIRFPQGPHDTRFIAQ